MILLIDVLTQLIVDAGLAALGTDLFQHAMADSIVEGVMIKEPLGGTLINHYTPGFLKGQIQLIVRSATYDAGTARAYALLPVLDFLEQDFNDSAGNFAMRIKYFRPRGLPAVYPRTPGNTIEWSIVFDACYVLAVPL